MFDPYNPFHVQEAKDYEASLFADAKANPRIGKGMSVEIFELHDDGSIEVCCRGLVIDFPEWDEAAGMHKAKVLVEGKKYMIYDTCMRRALGAIRDVYVNGGMA